MKVHHIGYAVRNIESSLKAFEKMGFHLEGNITHDEIRKVDICFLVDKDGANKVELIAPYEDGSDVSGVLKKWGGPTPYHICYEVEDIDSFINENRKSYLVMKKPEIAPAIDGKRVAFLYNKDFGLFEIVEE